MQEKSDWNKTKKVKIKNEKKENSRIQILKKKQ